MQQEKREDQKLIPEEHNSVLEEPKLTNSSSDEPFELPPPPSAPNGSRREDGILNGRGGCSIGNKNFSKSEDPRWDLSLTSSMRADSLTDRPFFLKNSNTDSNSTSSIEAKMESWNQERRSRRRNKEKFMGL